MKVKKNKKIIHAKKCNSIARNGKKRGFVACHLSVWAIEIA